MKYCKWNSFYGTRKKEAEPNLLTVRDRTTCLALYSDPSESSATYACTIYSQRMTEKKEGNELLIQLLPSPFILVFVVLNLFYLREYFG